MNHLPITLKRTVKAEAAERSRGYASAAAGRTELAADYARSWDPHNRCWYIDGFDWALILAATLKNHGHVVVGLEPPPQQRQRGDDANWARQMFHAVGSSRHGPVYRALSRVLHPDTPTGDTQLQRELNEAHAEISTNNRRESA